MRRRWLNLLTGLSLLLCLGVAGLWVRSYLPADFYAFGRRGRVIVAFSESQRSQMLAFRDGISPDVIAAWDDARSSARVHWAGPGVEFVAGPAPFVATPRGAFGPFTAGEYRMLSVSYAYLAVPAAAAAGALVYAARRRSALARRGHCHSCGYDLRATPGRCPECGALPAPAAART